VKRLVLLLLLIFSTFPLFWTLASSFRPEADLFGGASLFPRTLTVEHYRALWNRREFWLPIRNSLIVAGATTLFCLILGSFAAYAIARLRFRGKRAVLALILAVSMFPQISIVTPLFLFLRGLRLIDTFPGLILPYVTFALPLTVWLLTGYFRQIPIELDEAARIDGAGRMEVFFRIILPLAAPGLAATAVLTFVYCWNEFLFALAFTLGPDRQTVPVAIALFRGRYEVPWGEILAAAIAATLPVAVIVLAFQRRIVQGLTAGAVKG
jgi:ABC-type glycerol-3-phosphate transport system permease component